jgi:hypothetical protein
VEDKERMMNVAQLIEVLRQLPQDLEVDMAMNFEYQCPVEAGMVVVQEHDGRRYVCINDCAESPDT